MHEMSIVTEIIAIARASVPSEMAKAAIRRIDLKIGKFSTVIPENLRYCFAMATHDTDLADARLHIEEVPLTVRCGHCFFLEHPNEPRFVCSRCGNSDMTIIRGREMEIVSISIEDPIAHENQTE